MAINPLPSLLTPGSWFSNWAQWSPFGGCLKKWAPGNYFQFDQKSFILICFLNWVFASALIFVWEWGRLLGLKGYKPSLYITSTLIFQWHKYTKMSKSESAAQLSSEPSTHSPTHFSPPLLASSNISEIECIILPTSSCTNDITIYLITQQKTLNHPDPTSIPFSYLISHLVLFIH